MLWVLIYMASRDSAVWAGHTQRAMVVRIEFSTRVLNVRLVLCFCLYVQYYSIRRCAYLEGPYSLFHVEYQIVLLSLHKVQLISRAST